MDQAVSPGGGGGAAGGGAAAGSGGGLPHGAAPLPEPRRFDLDALLHPSTPGERPQARVARTFILVPSPMILYCLSPSIRRFTLGVSGASLADEPLMGLGIRLFGGSSMRLGRALRACAGAFGDA